MRRELLGQCPTSQSGDTRQSRALFWQSTAKRVNVVAMSLVPLDDLTRRIHGTVVPRLIEEVTGNWSSDSTAEPLVPAPFRWSTHLASRPESLCGRAAQS
jgi:hypothetical protein